MEITIAELVRNGTMSAEMAATLWAAVDERRSFLTVAIPRFAGKSTTSEAILALRAADIALHRLDGSEEQMEQLNRERLGGYLVVGEFSQAPVPGYIWGKPVQRVFETLAAGYSLQAALHAASVEEAIRVVTEGNGVSDELASAFDLVLYIERFGEPRSGEERSDRNDASYWRRLAHLYELDRVENGAPQGRTLFRWLEDGDQFEAVETPRSFSSEQLDERAAVIAELVASGRTSASDVAAAVAAFRTAS